MFLILKKCKIHLNTTLNLTTTHNKIDKNTITKTEEFKYCNNAKKTYIYRLKHNIATKCYDHQNVYTVKCKIKRMTHINKQ